MQQHVRDALRLVGRAYGLQDGDIESRGMGQNGTDIIMSPAATSVFGPLAIECKNVENLNVGATFFAHSAKYADHLNLLVHSKNRMPHPLVTLTLPDFIRMYSKLLDNARKCEQPTNA